MAAAQRSRALPVRPHLKQWKAFLSRLAEKQRAVPEVDLCRGQGPRCWAPLPRSEQPSSCKTAAMVMAATAVAPITVAETAAAATVVAATPVTPAERRPARPLRSCPEPRE